MSYLIAHKVSPKHPSNYNYSHAANQELITHLQITNVREQKKDDAKIH